MPNRADRPLASKHSGTDQQARSSQHRGIKLIGLSLLVRSSAWQLPGNRSARREGCRKQRWACAPKPQGLGREGLKAAASVADHIKALASLFMDFQVPRHRCRQIAAALPNVPPLWPIPTRPARHPLNWCWPWWGRQGEWTLLAADGVAWRWPSWVTRASGSERNRRVVQRYQAPWCVRPSPFDALIDQRREPQQKTKQ